MNKIVFYSVLFICFILTQELKSQQNLVLNGSFEDFFSCPISNDLGNDQLELSKGWWKPTLGTSDYFNTCNTNLVGIPNNFWGYQPAEDGDAYVGIVPLTLDLETGKIEMEYIQTKLTQKLIPCFEYRFSMFVSLANQSKYGFGDLSVFFTDQLIDIQTDGCIGLVPQITNTTNPIIDTSQWFEIIGSFVANGSEEYLTIGYKGSTFIDDTILIQDINPGLIYGYYYIDNVTLIQLSQQQIENCDLIDNQIANVITPNDDGINDFFLMTGLLPDETYSIINRWGNTIFIGTNVNPWDGKSEDGKECCEGIYFYVTQKKTGFIQLLR